MTQVTTNIDFNQAESMTQTPVILADEEGTGAQPVTAEEAVVHVEPTAAAKELRKLVRQLQEQPQQATAGNALPSIEAAFKYLERISTDISAIYAEYDKFYSLRQQLDTAISARRIADGKNAASQIRKVESDVLRHVRRTNDSLAEARYQLNNAKAYATQAQGGAPQPKLKKIADRMHILIQSLPTVTNAPLTPPDNILRAISTILKNGGYYKP